MNEDIVTQKLRDFTVQIRPADSEAIVGTGMVVSTDGKVVTCAHVVKSAGVEPRVMNGKELDVYFPQVSAGGKKGRHAKVIAYFPDFDDDVVLLQLTDGSAPLGLEKMPVIGTARKSQGNPFRSYGYRRLEDYIAGWADGRIQGHVESPPKRKVQEEPLQLESNQINRGMSGSAVLDIKRNLVVGIVSETWFPDKSGKDNDTGWAVDSRVLSLEPLGLPVQETPHPRKPAPFPKYDIAQAKASVFIKEKYSWNNAPAVLKEWTGRDEFLQKITEDWNNPNKHVTGLIGFGGEGKSSLARKWVDNLLNDPLLPRPDGVFWWGFYENRNVDEFLEAALNYMGGGKIDPRQIQSSNLRAQIIGAMLGAGRYLFVLDGFEVTQRQDGDQYGLVTNNDLRDLLIYFARPDNQSFCLITSRAPLLDLMEYTTYTHRDVDRLLPEDGRSLLKNLGVKGSENELAVVVSDWDGHALTLSLLAAYLTDKYDGYIRHLHQIPRPSAFESRYERVHRILRRYDDHLTKFEREFLKIFSCFRTPVPTMAIKTLFAPLLKKITQVDKAKDVPKLMMKDRQHFSAKVLEKTVERLLFYRLIRFDHKTGTYVTHPLIRDHYSASFLRNRKSQRKFVHEQIRYFYLSTSGKIKKFPTLEHIKPLIEAMHHTCLAGNYDEGYNIYTKLIDQNERWVLSYQIGAYSTDLSLMSEFFPNRDFSKRPLLTDLTASTAVLNETGTCLMSLGRLEEARTVYNRSVSTIKELKDMGDVCMTYGNLAELNMHLGLLSASQNFAQQALDLARQIKDIDNEVDALTYYAWASYLEGNIKLAEEYFGKAEALQRKTSPKERFLWSMFGTWHTDFLRRIGQINYARKVALWNLAYSMHEDAKEDISLCHRALGDLDAVSNHNEDASIHFSIALKEARDISAYHVLIEALLGYGRWVAKKNNDFTTAFANLNEALSYANESGYRIYEADIRVALGWAWLSASDQFSVNTDQWSAARKSAKAEAERALEMSRGMGYHWGKVDAEEVLERIESREQ